VDIVAIRNDVLKRGCAPPSRRSGALRAAKAEAPAAARRDHQRFSFHPNSSMT